MLVLRAVPDGVATIRPACDDDREFVGEIDRGFGDQRVYALQQEKVNDVAAARATAPALAQLAGYRAP